MIIRASARSVICFGSLEPLDLHGIVLERHRVRLLEERADEVLDPAVVGGRTMNSRPSVTADDVTLLDHDLSALDHIPRIREQEPALVRLLGIDRHVGIGADTQMALLRQAQRTRRTRRRDDRDVIQRVLPVEIRQHNPLLRHRRKLLDLLLPEVHVHQELHDLRVPPEAAAIGMVGRQKHPPRIVDEQQQLEPDRPLHGVDDVVVFVDVGDDAAAGFVLDVQVSPLAAGELIQQVLPRAVRGDRDGIAKEHRARIASSGSDVC